MHLFRIMNIKGIWGRRGRNRRVVGFTTTMVVGFTTTYAISAYHH